MVLSFNLDQFLALIKNYNLAVWPLQVIAYMLGVAVLLLVALKTKYSGRIIAAILALFWLWTGGVFKLIYFRPFYPIDIAFVLLLFAQGIIFAAAAAEKPQLSFSFQRNPRTLTAKVLALYALVGYPLLEVSWGRGYPMTLPFGMVPCPTALFTLAILLLSDRKLPWHVFTIPLLYAFGGIIPLANGIREDFGLLAGGMLAAYFLVIKRKKAGSA